MSNNLAKYDILAVHGIIAEDTNHKLVVQTATGQYIGKLYNPTNMDYPYVSAISQKINDMRISEYDKENPTAILMVDVELRTSSIGGPFKMPYVCLFLDQILGVSIGNLEQPIEE
ncbi:MULTISPECIES: hypothetical protein [unclassified Streptococcus]|uniref:hypothetical protein n=1 Tax=unclassified Streptococcus TaxID=2608887 RepID=UPI00211B6D75|nr:MULTISPECIES: hypothetical protein [unclassified Streptococcus]MCQ9212255.1 hypothetical protein [Streptococcus sp. B01]MCQ9213586.1 hypothetical protein [Streptococcus sp. O1]